MKGFCVFCGNRESFHVEGTDTVIRDGKAFAPYFVRCEKCRATGPEKPTKYEAVKAFCCRRKLWQTL